MTQIHTNYNLYKNVCVREHNDYSSKHAEKRGRRSKRLNRKLILKNSTRQDSTEAMTAQQRLWRIEQGRLKRIEDC